MISVLTSVYNESLNEIRESIDSILTQSFSNFELIIVLDRPEYAEGFELLQDYAAKDPRIKLLVNEKNIGLAMSMNYAAQNAKGKYLLRMDADDVCLPDRFQLQYDAISSGAYDLICGNYDFIDEQGDLLPQQSVVYTDKQLERVLPFRNIIHHPTVIMSATKFHEVGGYRNYSCAQDYDLWLRMKCNGCRMHMMPEKLIRYRVRQASTTTQKRYKQVCTGEYIRKLYWRKEKMSGYSYEGYLAYLEKCNANDPAANADFIDNFTCYLEAKEKIKKGHVVDGLVDFCRVITMSRYYRPRVMRSMIIAAIMKSVK